MTTDSTFKLSTQIIEAGQQIQATANELREAELNTPQVVPPFVNPTPTPPLSPVVQGAGWLVEQAGNGLRSLGFDEAEPEVFTTESDVELIPTDASTDNSSTGFPLALLPVLPLLPTLPVDWSEQFNSQPNDELFPDNVKPSTGVIAAGETLQSIGLTGPGAALQAAGQTMRAFGFDEAEEDSITGGGQTMDAERLIWKIAREVASVAATGKPAVTVTAIQAAVPYGADVLKTATSDINIDEGLAQPWLPEVGVDALA